MLFHHCVERLFPHICQIILVYNIYGVCCDVVETYHHKGGGTVTWSAHVNRDGDVSGGGSHYYSDEFGFKRRKYFGHACSLAVFCFWFWVTTRLGIDD